MVCLTRGYSSVGRAMRSQCIGQGFESPYLHQQKGYISRKCNPFAFIFSYWLNYAAHKNGLGATGFVVKFRLTAGFCGKQKLMAIGVSHRDEFVVSFSVSYSCPFL